MNLDRSYGSPRNDPSSRVVLHGRSKGFLEAVSCSFYEDRLTHCRIFSSI